MVVEVPGWEVLIVVKPDHFVPTLMGTSSNFPPPFSKESNVEVYQI